MYAVIFKATIKSFDTDYAIMAGRMRDLALTQYRCKAFNACTEGDEEIAISYWESEADIRAWKQDAEHLEAQALGASKWYISYTVQIVEILREYSNR